jgi:hypothetical protein
VKISVGEDSPLVIAALQALRADEISTACFPRRTFSMMTVMSLTSYREPVPLRRLSERLHGRVSGRIEARGGCYLVAERRTEDSASS